MSYDLRYEVQELERNGYFIALLDGEKCPDLKSFIIEIGSAFNFPDYYGKNMDALHECINDLDWIPEKNYVLAVLNHEYFLANGSGTLKDEMWRLFEDVRNEWATVPNYEGEEQFRSKADFRIFKL